MIKKLTNIKIVYIFVFISLAMWAFFAYFTMTQMIQSQKIYAKIINLSGKQRMLSQKTTLMCKRLIEVTDKDIEQHTLKLISIMKEDHQFIINNLTSPKMEEIYLKEPYTLDKKVQYYFTLLDTFLESHDQELLYAIQDYSFKLLPDLNYAVYEFEKESNGKIEELLQREKWILLGTLVTLILEALLIVIPSIRKLDQKEQELLDLNNELENKIQKELKELQHKDQLLNQQSKLASMGEMIGNIAHQWRQPLSLISTAATGMQVEKQLGVLSDEKFNDLCTKINDNAQYLSQTIEDFRSFIKGDSQPVEFDLEKDIESFLKLVDSSVKKYNIQVVSNLEKNTILFGYPHELSQCFINIFNNAKDALVENTQEDTRYFFITQEHVNDKVIIKFLDNAGGIPHQTLPKIFEPYFTTKHKSQGTGLGLSMTYSLIVQGMQGNIEARNVSYLYNDVNYTGAEFSITLPLV